MAKPIKVEKLQTWMGANLSIGSQHRREPRRSKLARTH